MTTKIEQLYLEAEADVRNCNYHEAFEKYETILYEEPSYAPAHNSMGWIYKTQFDNYAKAENMFKAAIQSDPLYPHPYFHLATVYFDLEKFDLLRIHLEKSLRVTTIEKGWIYYRYGMIEETLKNYTLAIDYYKRAIVNTYTNEKIAEYKQDIERCENKIELTK
jgi:tetratricopeptide (TPR) repeat protein